MNLQTLTYQIDAEDRLIEVSSNWDTWAGGTDSKDLECHSVMHQDIFNFIQGESCRQFYCSLLKHVRMHGLETVFQFRCDSPGLRRFMQMKMTREKEGHVEFASSVISEESRPLVPLLDLRALRNHKLLIMCSICNKVKINDHDWVEVEQAVNAYGLFGVATFPQLSYGYSGIML